MGTGGYMDTSQTKNNPKRTINDQIVFNCDKHMCRGESVGASTGTQNVNFNKYTGYHEIKQHTFMTSVPATTVDIIAGLEAVVVALGDRDIRLIEGTVSYCRT